MVAWTPPAQDAVNLDKIIQKVQRMLALANDHRGNENEAANAAAMAQALISQYGLEMAQLEDAQTKAGTGEPIGGKREKKAHDRAAMYKYQRGLMEGVARTHFCRHFITEVHAESFGKMRKVKRHVLLGRSINILAATMVYDYLISTMDRLLPYRGTELRGKSALLWLEGCSERLVQRLDEKRRGMERESEAKRREEETRAKHPSAAPSSGGALVLADAYSTEEDFNQDFERGVAPGTTARERRESKARSEARAAEHLLAIADAKARGANEEILRYMSYGYTEKMALTLASDMIERQAKPEKPETDAQRQKRERSERAHREREDARYRRANERRDTHEFQQGAAKGGEIGLDTQVGRDERQAIG